MARKPKTVFVCQECGYESPKWMGQCICGAWNSFVEEKIASEAADDRRGRSTDQSRRKSAKLAEISSETHERIDTGIDISKWNIRASSLTPVNMSIRPTPYLTYSNLLRICSTTKKSCLKPSIANMFDE